MVLPLIIAGVAAAGVALQAYGLSQSYDAAQQQAELARQQAVQEQKIERQKQIAMELDAKRRQREAIRNFQKSRSMALAAATNQGAGGGSGLVGGYGQIAGEFGTNYTAILENLAIGRNIFAANQQISGIRAEMAATGAQAALGSGLQGLGANLVSSATTIGNIAGTAFGAGANKAPAASGYYQPGGYGYVG